jgi:tetrahydromethanopterin S-methyltransferase subunit B
MMLTDAEQKKLNDEMLDGPTTQKINKRLSESEERILKQMRPIVERVEEFDKTVEKVESHDGFLQKLRRGLNGIIK